jgi:hypothetical protein
MPNSLLFLISFGPMMATATKKVIWIRIFATNLTFSAGTVSLFSAVLILPGSGF